MRRFMPDADSMVRACVTALLAKHAGRAALRAPAERVFDGFRFSDEFGLQRAGYDETAFVSRRQRQNELAIGGGVRFRHAGHCSIGGCQPCGLTGATSEVCPERSRRALSRQRTNCHPERSATKRTRGSASEGSAASRATGNADPLPSVGGQVRCG